MTFNERAYKTNWERNKRNSDYERTRRVRMTNEGKCHICEILLTSKYHTGCPYLSTPEHPQEDRQTS